MSPIRTNHATPFNKHTSNARATSLPQQPEHKKRLCIWKEPYKRDPHCKCKQTCIADLLTLSWTSHTVIIHEETYIHHPICRHLMRGPRPCPNSQTRRLSLRFLGLSKSNLVHPGCACVYVYILHLYTMNILFRSRANLLYVYVCMNVWMYVYMYIWVLG